MNMNGTAVYQAVATVFLAQVYGLEMSVPTLGLVVITTVAASIGTPSAPGAGVIILATVLASAGIPVEGISVILGVDHLLGMCRTSVNVAGDLTACVVFARINESSTATAPVAADEEFVG
jgi:Na+/H+-dicarboxylate symporter